MQISTSTFSTADYIKIIIYLGIFTVSYTSIRNQTETNTSSLNEIKSDLKEMKENIKDLYVKAAKIEQKQDDYNKSH